MENPINRTNETKLYKILKVNKYYNCNMEIVMLNYFGRCIRFILNRFSWNSEL